MLDVGLLLALVLLEVVDDAELEEVEVEYVEVELALVERGDVFNPTW